MASTTRASSEGFDTFGLIGHNFVHAIFQTMYVAYCDLIFSLPLNFKDVLLNSLDLSNMFASVSSNMISG